MASLICSNQWHSQDITDARAQCGHTTFVRNAEVQKHLGMFWGHVIVQCIRHLYGKLAYSERTWLVILWMNKATTVQLVLNTRFAINNDANGISTNDSDGRTRAPVCVPQPGYANGSNYIVENVHLSSNWNRHHTVKKKTWTFAKKGWIYLYHFLSISLDEQQSITGHILLLCKNFTVIVCTKLSYSLFVDML